MALPWSNIHNLVKIVPRPWWSNLHPLMPKTLSVGLIDWVHRYQLVGQNSSNLLVRRQHQLVLGGQPPIVVAKGKVVKDFPSFQQNGCKLVYLWNRDDENLSGDVLSSV